MQRKQALDFCAMTFVTQGAQVAKIDFNVLFAIVLWKKVFCLKKQIPEVKKVGILIKDYFVFYFFIIPCTKLAFKNHNLCLARRANMRYERSFTWRFTPARGKGWRKEIVAALMCRSTFWRKSRSNFPENNLISSPCRSSGGFTSVSKTWKPI